MHTIRLREPWEVEVAPGGIVYRRHFNRPTGLEQGEVVRLKFEPLSPGLSVRFNDEPLPQGCSVWDITLQLQLRNSVVILYAGASVPVEHPFSDVRLEILPGPQAPRK